MSESSLGMGNLALDPSAAGASAASAAPPKRRGRPRKDQSTMGSNAMQDEVVSGTGAAAASGVDSLTNYTGADAEDAAAGDVSGLTDYSDDDGAVDPSPKPNNVSNQHTSRTIMGTRFIASHPYSLVCLCTATRCFCF